MIYKLSLILSISEEFDKVVRVWHYSSIEAAEKAFRRFKRQVAGWELSEYIHPVISEVKLEDLSGGKEKEES